MSYATQNRLIARLIVGAMSIDGSMSKKEREKVIKTLTALHMEHLIPDFGEAIDEDLDSFNMFGYAKELIESLGSHAKDTIPLVFTIVCDVVASDRFVSANEAAYLAGLAKRLGLSMEKAKSIFKEVMAARRGRLEVSGSNVSEHINAQLKELLSFEGAEDIVGELDSDSLEEMLSNAHDAFAEGQKVAIDEVERAFAILGLKTNAKLVDATKAWKENFDSISLSKMADLGETFVSAALARLTNINDAYKTIHAFHENTKKK